MNINGVTIQYIEFVRDFHAYRIQALIETDVISAERYTQTVHDVEIPLPELDSLYYRFQGHGIGFLTPVQLLYQDIRSFILGTCHNGVRVEVKVREDIED